MAGDSFKNVVYFDILLQTFWFFVILLGGCVLSERSTGVNSQPSPTDPVFNKSTSGQLADISTPSHTRLPIHADRTIPPRGLIQRVVKINPLSSVTSRTPGHQDNDLGFVLSTQKDAEVSRVENPNREMVAKKSKLNKGKFHLSLPDKHHAHRNLSVITTKRTFRKVPLRVANFRPKRSHKQKRFLSNIRSSLKAHIKNSKVMWKAARAEVSRQFDDYYRCIKARVDILKRNEFPIKALLAVEGERMEMPCPICFRPDQDAATQQAIWQVLRHEDTTMEDIHPSGKFKVTEQNTLIVDQIDVSNAGQYFCVKKRDYAQVYQLDVFLADKRIHIKLGERQEVPEVLMMEMNLRVFNMWAPWGDCNTCDRKGTRTRVGQCTVNKIYPDLPVFPRDYPLMTLYPEGIPCHSTALPRHIRRRLEISGRDSESQTAPCFEKCPTDPPVTVVTDATGEVVEVLEPGFHSMKDKPPKLPSMIKRKVLYEPHRSHLVLKCPTTAKRDMIHWMRKDREIFPNEVKQQTKGRVFVDYISRLHIVNLMLSDTDVYSCWKKNTKVAIIKVIVVSAHNQNIKHYISYAGLAITVIGSLLCVFCILCKKSDKNTK